MSGALAGKYSPAWANKILAFEGCFQAAFRLGAMSGEELAEI